MSQVTCCDFCMATSRTAGETTKIDLPRGMVPEPLHGLAVNATITTIKLDVCQACQAELAELLDDFIGRRFGATPPSKEASP